MGHQKGLGTIYSIPEYVYSITDSEGYFFYFLNATIIKAGYAKPHPESPNVKHTELFQKLYEEARKERRGLWKDE